MKRIALAAWLACLALALPAPAQELPVEVAPTLDVEPEAEANRWTFTPEYVIWWIRQGRVPAILTTSSAASQGLLGAPDTRIVYGNDRIETRHDDRFIGTRFALEYWVNPEHTLAVEGRCIFLERDSTWFRATSDGSVLLARPYYNAIDGSPQSEIIAGPGPRGLLSGGFNGYSRIEFFSQEVNVIRPLWDTPTARLDLLAGARFLQMRDRTDLTTASKLLPDAAIVFGQADHFRAHDLFTGGQLGLRGEVSSGRWFLGSRAEVALGGNNQKVRAFGDRVYHTPLERTTSYQGFSVQPSNAGTHTRTSFNSIYELNVNAGVRLWGQTRWFVGYTLFVWDAPIRAGDQIDLALNPTQFTGPLVGPARPHVPFKEDVLVIQGVNFGLEFRW